MNGSGGIARSTPAGTDRGTRRSRRTVSRRGLFIAGSATAVVAFVAGLGLAVLDRGTETQIIAAPPATVDRDRPAATSSSTSSTTIAVAPPPSIEPPTTPPPTAAPTTRPPTTPPPTVVETVPPTAAPVPARIQVTYPRDPQGRMVLRAGSTGVITLRNTGGSLGQYLVQSSGYVSVGGPASGSLGAGQVAQVTVRAAFEPPEAGAQGTVTVTGASVGTVSIPVLVTR